MDKQLETNKKQKKAKPIRCVVSSDKMDKSRVATLERLVKHPVYGKYERHRTKIMFHDEQNTSKLGDEVLLTQSRPHSKRKRFSLLKVLSSGRLTKAAMIDEQL